MAKNRDRQRANRRLKESKIERVNGSKINDPTAYIAVNGMINKQFEGPKGR